MALLSEFQTLYQELPSYREIFSPILDMMDKLPVNKYPLTLQVNSCYTSIVGMIDQFAMKEYLGEVEVKWHDLTEHLVQQVSLEVSSTK